MKINPIYVCLVGSPDHVNIHVGYVMADAVIGISIVCTNGYQCTAADTKTRNGIARRLVIYVLISVIILGIILIRI